MYAAISIFLQLFSLGVFLRFLWAMLTRNHRHFLGSEVGAFVFTLDAAVVSNDKEEWTFTSLIGDTLGTLTFRNPDYKPHPGVVLVPTDGSVVGNSIYLGTPGAQSITVHQTASIGAGQGRIIVTRPR